MRCRFGTYTNASDEHKGPLSSIGKHFREKHVLVPKDLSKNFIVLKKSANKLDCLVYEMILITDELRPSLNAHSDSICAKVFK